MLTKEQQGRVAAALDLIAATPGYAAAARDLARLQDRGRIRFAPTLADRAHAGLTGRITLGPEALDGSVLGLAETLVHEYHHTRQFPLLKTLSFWKGVLTRTPVLRAYERPAYQAACDFLTAVARHFPDLTAEAAAEHAAVRETFAANYGGPWAA